MPKEPLKMVSREEWQALPPKSSELLKLPATMLLMLDTGTEECYFQEDCLKAVQNLQKHYMEEKGLDDIPWSFLVGGDGRIYEGRGWTTKPIKTDLTNKVQADNDGKSYDIAYIGDYRNTLPRPESSEAVIRLINIAKKNNYIDKVEFDIQSTILRQRKIKEYYR